MRAVIVFVMLVSFESAASAQSVSKSRLNDWEFRYYACKNVLMNAAIVVRIMAEHNITDQRGIDALHYQLGPTISEAVTNKEKLYRFVDDEGLFVSDLTFSVLYGMLQGGLELSETQLISSGSDLCITTIEALAQ